MGPILEQDRLNVTKKSRTNLFSWRGQFTPEFVEYLLETFASEAHIVLDPFCGSGTVLQECVRREISASGFEINPAAYAMSKFFTFSNVHIEERRQLIDSLSKHLDKLPNYYEDLPLFKPSPKYREMYKNLLDFAKDLFKQTISKQETLLAVLMIFRAQDSKNNGLLSAVMNAFSILKSNLLSLPFANSNISVELCDARRCHTKLNSPVDMIITSPPYINVFNYHQNYRAILEILGFDILKIARSEIGSNRKNRGNRFRTVVQYCLDMKLSLYSLAKSFRKGGKLILVLGRESRVRGVPFENSQIARDIIECLGCFGKVSSYEREFINRYGQIIKEDILVTEQEQVAGFTESSRDIAISHLEHALAMCDKKVRNDIRDTIAMVPHIQPSTIFKCEEII